MCRCSSAFGMRSANFFTGPPSRKDTLIDGGPVAPQEGFLGRKLQIGIETAAGSRSRPQNVRQMRYCAHPLFKGDGKPVRRTAWKTEVEVLHARLGKGIAERKDLDGFRQNTAFGRIDKSHPWHLLNSVDDEVAVGNEIFRGLDFASPDVDRPV